MPGPLSGLSPQATQRSAPVSRIAYDAAVTYINEHQPFARPIMKSQGILLKIADMATQIHAAHRKDRAIADNQPMAAAGTFIWEISTWVSSLGRTLRFHQPSRARISSISAQ